MKLIRWQRVPGFKPRSDDYELTIEHWWMGIQTYRTEYGVFWHNSATGRQVGVTRLLDTRLCALFRVIRWEEKARDIKNGSYQSGDRIYREALR